MPSVIIPGRATKGLRRGRVVIANRHTPQYTGLTYWGVPGWPGDGLGGDTATRTGDATLRGSALGGLAYSLDGTGDSMQFPYLSRYNTTVVTVCAWITTTTTSNYRTVLGRISSGTAKSFWLALNNVDNKFFLQFSTSGSNQCGTSPTSTGTVPTNTLTHLISSFDGSSVRHWLNGVRDSTITPDLLGSIASTSTPVEIGSIFGGGTDNLPGTVHEARIYNFANISDGWAWSLYDPATRWDLYWVPGRRVYFDVGAAAFDAALFPRTDFDDLVRRRDTMIPSGRVA